MLWDLWRCRQFIGQSAAVVHLGLDILSGWWFGGIGCSESSVVELGLDILCGGSFGHSDTESSVVHLALDAVGGRWCGRVLVVMVFWSSVEQVGESRHSPVVIGGGLCIILTVSVFHGPHLGSLVVPSVFVFHGPVFWSLVISAVSVIHVTSALWWLSDGVDDVLVLGVQAWLLGCHAQGLFWRGLVLGGIGDSAFDDFSEVIGWLSRSGFEVWLVGDEGRGAGLFLRDVVDSSVDGFVEVGHGIGESGHVGFLK